jgi:predicted pyridoxine 5'-phosphate oxidase superfamily flavin-nucleotide-binding protein
MIKNFGDLAFTPGVKAAQETLGSRHIYARIEGVERRHRLTSEETDFIAERDSFYMATVGENGWPYVQFRGGPKGFLRVLSEETLGFADFTGNRQYISLGNINTSHRACLFLMDYPHQLRLKIWADATVSDDADLVAQLAMPNYPAKPVRAFLFHVHAFDWNCPQHITPRYTLEEYALTFPNGAPAQALSPSRQSCAPTESPIPPVALSPQ